MSLADKGWQPHQITRAISLIQSSQSVKSDSVRLLDSFIYWGVLLAAILGNFVLSITIIPILLVFTDIALLISVGLIALAFGLVLDFILREIEHLQSSHLVIPELFIPAIALINIYIITNLGNAVSALLKLPTQHNPLLVSMMYVCGFIIPHFALKYGRNKAVARPTPH